MPKYKDYYKQMIDQNKTLFDDFYKIHQQFKENKDQFRDIFNQDGQKVVDVIRDWDRRLCSAMGRGKFSVYSQQVSEKFWNLARQDFELIDLVGVKVVKR
jgi:hypothetical protein